MDVTLPVSLQSIKKNKLTFENAIVSFPYDLNNENSQNQFDILLNQSNQVKYNLTFIGPFLFFTKSSIINSSNAIPSKFLPHINPSFVIFTPNFLIKNPSAIDANIKSIKKFENNFSITLQSQVHLLSTISTTFTQNTGNSNCQKVTINSYNYYVDDINITFTSSDIFNTFLSSFSSFTADFNNLISSCSERELCKIGSVNCLGIINESNPNGLKNNCIFINEKFKVTKAKSCNLVLVHLMDGYSLQLHGTIITSNENNDSEEEEENKNENNDADKSEAIACLLDLPLGPSSTVLTFNKSEPESAQARNNRGSSNFSFFDQFELKFIDRFKKKPDLPSTFAVTDDNLGIEVVFCCENQCDALGWVASIHAWIQKANEARKTAKLNPASPITSPKSSPRRRSDFGVVKKIPKFVLSSSSDSYEYDEHSSDLNLSQKNEESSKPSIKPAESQNAINYNRNNNSNIKRGKSFFMNKGFNNIRRSPPQIILPISSSSDDYYYSDNEYESDKSPHDSNHQFKEKEIPKTKTNKNTINQAKSNANSKPNSNQNNNQRNNEIQTSNHQSKQNLNTKLKQNDKPISNESISEPRTKCQQIKQSNISNNKNESLNNNNNDSKIENTASAQSKDSTINDFDKAKRDNEKFVLDTLRNHYKAKYNANNRIQKFRVNSNIHGKKFSTNRQKISTNTNNNEKIPSSVNNNFSGNTSINRKDKITSQIKTPEDNENKNESKTQFKSSEDHKGNFIENENKTSNPKLQKNKIDNNQNYENILSTSSNNHDANTENKTSNTTKNKPISSNDDKIKLTESTNKKQNIQTEFCQNNPNDSENNNNLNKHENMPTNKNTKQLLNSQINEFKSTNNKIILNDTNKIENTSTINKYSNDSKNTLNDQKIFNHQDKKSGQTENTSNPSHYQLTDNAKTRINQETNSAKNQTVNNPNININNANQSNKQIKTSNSQPSIINTSNTSNNHEQIKKIKKIRKIRKTANTSNNQSSSKSNQTIGTPSISNNQNQTNKNNQINNESNSSNSHDQNNKICKTTNTSNNQSNKSESNQVSDTKNNSKNQNNIGKISNDSNSTNNQYQNYNVPHIIKNKEANNASSSSNNQTNKVNKTTNNSNNQQIGNKNSKHSDITTATNNHNQINTNNKVINEANHSDNQTQINKTDASNYHDQINKISKTTNNSNNQPIINKSSKSSEITTTTKNHNQINTNNKIINETNPSDNQTQINKTDASNYHDQVNKISKTTNNSSNQPIINKSSKSSEITTTTNDHNQVKISNKIINEGNPSDNQTQINKTDISNNHDQINKISKTTNNSNNQPVINRSSKTSEITTTTNNHNQINTNNKIINETNPSDNQTQINKTDASNYHNQINKISKTTNNSNNQPIINKSNKPSDIKTTTNDHNQINTNNKIINETNPSDNQTQINKTDASNYHDQINKISKTTNNSSNQPIINKSSKTTNNSSNQPIINRSSKTSDITTTTNDHNQINTNNKIINEGNPSDNQTQINKADIINNHDQINKIIKTVNNSNNQQIFNKSSKTSDITTTTNDHNQINTNNKIINETNPSDNQIQINKTDTSNNTDQININDQTSDAIEPFDNDLSESQDSQTNSSTKPSNKRRKKKIIRRRKITSNNHVIINKNFHVNTTTEDQNPQDSENNSNTDIDQTSKLGSSITHEKSRLSHHRSAPNINNINHISDSSLSIYIEDYDLNLSSSFKKSSEQNQTKRKQEEFPFPYIDGKFDEESSINLTIGNSKSMDDVLTHKRLLIEHIRRSSNESVLISTPRPTIVENFIHKNAVDTYIKSLVNKFSDDQEEICIDSYEECDERTTEEIILSSLQKSQRVKMNISDFVKLNDFNNFDFNQLANCTTMKRPIVEEYALVIQQIVALSNNNHVSIVKRIGASITDFISKTTHHGNNLDSITITESSESFRLCFLICALFLNGLKGFNSFGLENEFLNALEALAIHVASIREIYSIVSNEKTILTQISKFVILLLNTHLLIFVLESILDQEEWISEFYSMTSYLRDEETLRQIIICQRVIQNMAFDINENSKIIFNSTHEDKIKFIFRPAYSFLEINSIEKMQNKDQRMKSIVEFFVKEINNGSSGKGWQFLTLLIESNHSKMNCDFKLLCESIQDAKKNVASSEYEGKRIQAVLEDGIKYGLLHIWFIIMLTAQELTQQFFADDSIFIDLYRSNHVLEVLADMIQNHLLY